MLDLIYQCKLCTKTEFYNNPTTKNTRIIYITNIQYLQNQNNTLFKIKSTQFNNNNNK